MKILICFGTRPEAIKMAPICLELKQRNIPFKLCVTAQHREMLDQVLDFFELIPDYDLDLMTPNQNLNQLSSRILKEVDGLFEQENFDIVLVHGDTTTSSMVALSAFHRNIKVAHIEAGLRTYNKQSPFPEELNRQLTGRIANYHFTPTKKSYSNLINEGVHESNILITGNTVIDSLFFVIQKINNGYENIHIENLKNQIDFSKKLILVTGHRRENLGIGFENICNSIIEISKDTNVEIVFPVHLNPNVQKIVFQKLSNKHNVHLISPLDYPTFIWFMSKAFFIISDSGGIQEEAPSLNIPVLVTRNTTERFEGVNEGFSFLVGTDTAKIIEKSLELLSSFKGFENKLNPYGDGKASKKIVSFLEYISQNKNQ